VIPLAHQENDFLCGNLLAQCSIYIDWFGNMWYPFDDTMPVINMGGDNILSSLSGICYGLKNNRKDYVFCRLELIPYLFTALNYYNIKECVLFSTSDHLLDNRFLNIIDDKRILHWYGHNVAIQHPKVTPLPLGIRIFSDEELNMYHDVLRNLPVKTRLYNANFNIDSNPKERNKCKSKCEHSYTSIPIDYSNRQSVIDNRKTWHYNIASSYFELAPRGFSIPTSNQGDNHRIWESLYHRTIPVTTRSPLTDKYAKIFPIMVIDDWDSFNINTLTKELYHRMWQERPRAEKCLGFHYFFKHFISD